jgi:hypothetical protein
MPLTGRFDLTADELIDEGDDDARLPRTHNRV